MSWVGVLGSAVVEVLLVGRKEDPIPAARVEKDGCLEGDHDMMPPLRGVVPPTLLDWGT